MKRFFLMLITASCSTIAFAQNVGINNPAPDASSVLDIKSSNKGLLIPRVALSSVYDNTTIASPATSLMVYNTTAASSGTSAVEPGFYYWNGYNWVKVMTSTSAASLWKMGGNANTTPETDFIGTTDSKSLMFKVNNKTGGLIDVSTSNAFFGIYAGEVNATTANTGFGAYAMKATTTGSGNVAVGSNSLYLNTVARDNVAVGIAALYNTNAVLGYNTAVGGYAGYYLTSGDRNTAIGNMAMQYTMTGSSNTALGDRASMPSGISNATAIGANSFANCVNCLVLGSVGGVNSANSDVNVGIGNSTPTQPLTFRSALGGKISLFQTGSTHYGIGIANSLMQFYVGFTGADFAFGSGTSTGFSEVVRIKANGKLGILTESPEAALDVRRGANSVTAQFYGSSYITHFNYMADEHTYIRGGKAGAHVFLNDIPGAGNVGVGVVTPQYKLDVKGIMRCIGFINESDARLKKDIVPITSTLENLSKLNAYHYNWIDTTLDTSLQTGVIAQEVKAVYPELVKTDGEGIMSVNYQGLVPLLIEAVKELKREIEDLKKKL